MVEDAEKQYKSFSPQQVDGLTAIYNDYLYIAREHEKLLQVESINGLANIQVETMNPDKKPVFPWEVDFMTDEEKKDFKEFIDNDEYEKDNRSYVTLKHIKSEYDNGFSKKFSIPPYMMMSMNMQMPSLIERCSIIYPENCKVGDTEFLIDGMYKVTYTDEKTKDMLMTDFIKDTKMTTEFYIMLNLAELVRYNDDVEENQIENLFANVYAAETIVTNENVILELIGSFAERLLVICREIYNLQDSREVFNRAEQEGLIKSAEEFQKYINIRNFLRHQWDTLDELGHFSPQKSNKNKIVRDIYVKSYLELCDKTIIQRMKSYIDVLHQMQNVMEKIHPGWMIRDVSESNNKFFQRVKNAANHNPGQPVTVELNLPLASEKHASLKKNLHKFIPQINIVDEFPDEVAKQKQLDDYNLRSWFLQTFKSVECMVMRHCMIRGKDLRHKEAWDYMETVGVLNPRERLTWKNYAILRNMLSHEYFNENLRKQLFDTNKAYSQDLQALTARILTMSPDVTKIEPGVYEYAHQDGIVVTLDYNNHKVLEKRMAPITKKDITIVDTPKINVEAFKKQPQMTETIGCKFNVIDDKITSVKVPNGVVIDFDTSQINLGGGLWLDAHAQYTNVLRTSATKLLFDKNLHVDEYIEKNHKIPFRNGDNLLIDRQHRVQLDSASRIKEIKIKTGANNIVTVGVKHKNNGATDIIFADGTIISVMGQNITVSHNGVSLTFDNREIFAISYIDSKIAMQQQIQNVQR